MANYPYKQLGIGIDRDFRNDFNDNLKYIEDDFKEVKASNENLQQQVNKLVVEGDSSPQAIQASISANGTDYNGNLKARLDAEYNTVTAQLATMMTQTEFDSWVATLLDGGPSIFMETYSQLVSTYPNGSAGVALVRETDPSHIYVWNPSENSWQDYGEYQGMKPKDGTLGLDAFSSQGKLLRNYPLSGNANSLRSSDGNGKMYAGANIHQLFFIGKYDRYYIRAFFSKNSSDSSREISIRDMDGNEELKFHADASYDTNGTFIYPEKELCTLSYNGEVRGYAIISWSGVANIANYTFADTEIHASCFVNVNKIAGLMPDGFISTSKLGSAVVTNAKMAADSVGTSNIIDGNVTTRKSALQTMARNYPLASNAFSYRSATGGQSLYAGDCIHQLFFIGDYERYFIRAIFGKHSSDSYREITIRDKDSKQTLQFRAAPTYDTSGNFVYPEKEYCPLTDGNGVVRGFAVVSWAKAPNIADYAFVDTEIHSSCFINSVLLNQFITPPSDDEYDKVNQRLVSPKRMFVVKGESLPVYRDSLVYDSTKKGKYDLTLITYDLSGRGSTQYSFGAIPVYQSFDRQAIIEGKANLDTKLTLAVRPNGNTSKIYKSDIGLIVIDAATKNGKSTSIHCMGDSITEAGVPWFLQRRLVKYSVTASLIGTKAVTYGTGGHEGHAGKSLKQFIGARTDWESPYMKIATEEDKVNYPEWCFRKTGTTDTEKSFATDTDKTGDFYIFDFADYLSKNTLATPNIVTIALGTNDESMSLSWTYANFSNAIEFVIEQIKKVDTSISVGVIPPPTFTNSVYGNTRHVQNMVLVEDLINKVESIRATYTDVDIIPVYAHFNRDYNNYFSQTAQIESSNFYEFDITDDVHPTNTGREEYVNSMIPWVLNEI